MLVPQFEYSWQTLPNPFLEGIDPSKVIAGHVSGRNTDISYIISAVQSAIILMGAPNIGKSTLIRYLQQPPAAGWSWRDELVMTMPQEQLNAINFAQVDLTSLEGIESPDELLPLFLAQCIAALQSIYKPKEQTSSSLQDLRGLLRSAKQENPNARYFLMFDTIEHLGKQSDRQSPSLERIWTQQEHGLELLDNCGATHMLVDLIDEFRNFGVIFSLQSLPRPKISNQFVYISADLARFTNMVLQSFTWEDTKKFLAQQPENFGTTWAEIFEALGGSYIFSEAEQKWLAEQAGTHPYLLQQFCLYTFRLKQEYASINRDWAELQERAKHQLTERMSERLSTFFSRAWRRIEEAMDKSSKEVRSNFYDFIGSLAHKQARDVIEPALWDQLESELRYILYSEGIVRYNQFQDIHFPGSILRDYLVQKTQETSDRLSPSTVPATLSPARSYWLGITRPGEPEDRLPVTDLEYRLFKTLIDHAGHCTEADLMIAGWEKPVERSTFTQRMHHLRKKLRAQCREEIIENRYGGLYSLNHPEWFHLK